MKKFIANVGIVLVLALSFVAFAKADDEATTTDDTSTSTPIIISSPGIPASGGGGSISFHPSGHRQSVVLGTSAELNAQLQSLYEQLVALEAKLLEALQAK